MAPLEAALCAWKIVVSNLQAELVTLRKQASDSRALKEQETAEILSGFRVENAEKEDELEKLRSEHFAFAVKVTAMEELHKRTLETSPSQTLSIATSEAVSIVPQRVNLKAQQANEEVLNLAKQLADKNAYLDITYAELHSIKRELGKSKYDCLDQIEAVRKGDLQMRPKTGFNNGRLNTAMEIRLARYETQVWSEHFCEFVKAYARRVSKAHPEIKQWAETFGANSTTSVLLNTPVEASAVPPTQSTTSTARTPVSTYSMHATTKASPGASVASNVTSSSARQATPAPPTLVSAVSVSPGAVTTSANNKEASGSVTTPPFAPGGSSGACAVDGGRSDIASGATPSSTSVSQAQESASNGTSTTAEPVATGHQTPGLARSRYASVPVDTAPYPRPNPRKTLESASPALTNMKGSVGGSQVSNVGSTTTPVFSLPPTIFVLKGTGSQSGQLDDTWTPPSTATPVLFQGSNASKPPAPTRIRSKQAPQVDKKAPLPAKKLVTNSDRNNEGSAPGPAVAPAPKLSTSPTVGEKKQVTGMNASRWVPKK